MENPKSEILFVVARPGFEPRQTVPKTVVLPLYYQAIRLFRNLRPEKECKYKTKFSKSKWKNKKSTLLTPL